MDLWCRNFPKKIEHLITIRHFYMLCLIAIHLLMIRQQKYITTFDKHKHIGDEAHLQSLPGSLK